MASNVSNASSPSLGRISVEHPSIATTLSENSSSASASNAGSPNTSGTLSPLGLAPTPVESVSRTFKNALKHKKVLSTAHSAVSMQDHAALASLKFRKFQKYVLRVKCVPAMEHDEKKSLASKAVSPPLSLRAPKSEPKTVFHVMEDKEYFKAFPIKAPSVKRAGAHVLKVLPLFNAHVAGSVASKYNQEKDACERDVTAYEMGDSVAVFCLSQKEVLVHHVSSASTTIQAVCSQFEKFERDKEAIYHIYLVGGDGSSESAQLLHNIESAIQIFFGNKAIVKERFINISQKSDKPYISVACTTKREFFFCHHD